MIKAEKEDGTTFTYPVKDKKLKITGWEDALWIPYDRICVVCQQIEEN